MLFLKLFLFLFFFVKKLFSFLTLRGSVSKGVHKSTNAVRAIKAERELAMGRNSEQPPTAQLTILSMSICQFLPSLFIVYIIQYTDIFVIVFSCAE